MKKIIPILLTLALLVSFSAAQADDGAQVLDPTALFVPDITAPACCWNLRRLFQMWSPVP
ncbi:MAG: hypothetical protein MUC85_08410 [Anaerolineales bacterium]|nr:hypothetical protein [Anaerolineales bacterium]